MCTGRPSRRTRAAGAALGGAEQGLEDLGAPGAEEAADAEDLAGVEVEVDAVQHAPPAAAAGDVEGEIAGREDDRSDSCGSTRARVAVSRPTMAAISRARRHLGDRGGDDVAPVAQHGDAIGERHHLFDAVGDVDDADAFGGELADDAEQALALGGREGGGGLVHDEDAGVERQGLGDLDELLLAHAQAGGARLGVEVDAEAGEELCRAATTMARRSRKRPARSGSRPRKMLAATLSSGTRLSSWWMMATPARSASRTLAKRTGASSIRISPSCGGEDAGEDLHQRRLAGAVLAHERVNLAGAEVEVDAVERGDAGEALGDAGGAQERVMGRVAVAVGAGHASRTPPAVPPLPLGRGVGKRQARCIGARLVKENARYRRWQSESALRYRPAADGLTCQGG